MRAKGPRGPRAVGLLDEGQVVDFQGDECPVAKGRGAEDLVTGAKGPMDEGSRAGWLRAKGTRAAGARRRGPRGRLRLPYIQLLPLRIPHL